MPRVIGNERMRLHNRTKARRVRGYTPTCIAKKAIRETQLIGTVGQVSRFAGSRSMRNGSASSKPCLSKPKFQMRDRRLFFARWSSLD